MKRWFFVSTRKKRVTVKKVRCTDYNKNKELARRILTEKVHIYNKFYNLQYNRIAIKNQKTRWGSCSSLKNLNFNYKLIYLPDHLINYVVVHEICHLKELNHGKNFWHLVAVAVPDYKDRVRELQLIDRKTGGAVVHLKKLKYRQNDKKLYNETAHDDCYALHRGKSEHAHVNMEQGSG